MYEDPLCVICHLKSDSAGDLLEAMRRGGVEAALLPEGAHGRGPANRWRAALQVPRRQHGLAVAVLREYLEARPPEPYRPPGARGDPFRVCSTCGHRWPIREAFLGDPKVRLIGYQVNFSSLELGLLIFQHDGEHCHTSLAMTVGLFADLYDGPIYAESQAGSGECMEYCLRQEMLEVCPALCECACVREVVRAIRFWPKKA